MERVKITNCTDFMLWYSDKIGQDFEIIRNLPREKCYLVRTDNGTSNIVFYKDCVFFYSKEFVYEIIHCSLPNAWYCNLISVRIHKDSIMHETDNAIWIKKNHVKKDNAWIYKKDLRKL